jgi:hypothetical protein
MVARRIKVTQLRGLLYLVTLKEFAVQQFDSRGKALGTFRKMAIESEETPLASRSIECSL